jgi:hypothetical protein
MATPKEVKVKDPVEAAHEAWFFALEPKYVVQLMKEWNETNLNIVIKKKKDYDAWFNYFRKIPASHIKMLVATGQDILDAEAYSALRMWADIISTPARMNKVHQTGLSKKGNKKNSVLAMAQANDRLGALKIARDKIAEKLDKGAGSRDTALLTAQLTEIMTQIADYEKRLGPNADTPLGALFADMPDAVGKREKNAGARNTSFRSRITIDDLETPQEEAK